MASLPESSTFDAGVYQLELTDPVIGGPSGVSNTPLKNLANRTKYLKDHVDALESSRAPLASPALTGTPTAPTAPQGTSTTQLATTAFVNAEIAADMAANLAAAAPLMDGTAAVGTSGKSAREDHVHPSDTTRAPLASPAFTGTPTAPTPAAGDNSTKLANTAFVKGAVDSVQTQQAGEVAFFAKNTPPSGWLKANGAAVSRSVYSALFSAIGTTFGAGDGLTTFNIPDLRGEFLRAWDDARGIDSGRAFGTWQRGTLMGGDFDGINAQTMGSVTTLNPASGTSHVGADPLINPADYPNALVAAGGAGTNFTPTGTPYFFGVTRPRNIAMLACIKF